MNALLEADVLESCLLSMPPGRKKSKVRAVDIAEKLRWSNPNYACLSVAAISKMKRIGFPIYKNPGSNPHILKVSS